MRSSKVFLTLANSCTETTFNLTYTMFGTPQWKKSRGVKL